MATGGILLLLAAGCGPKMAVRPTIAPGLDEPARRKLYDDYALHYSGHQGALLLPTFVIGVPRWERADGRYAPEQMTALWEQIPSLDKIGEGSLVNIWTYLGLAIGVELAEVSLLRIGGWLFIAEPQCEGIAAILLHGDMTGDEMNAERTDAYNAALAAQLGLALTPTPTAVDHVERERPWMRGAVVVEGAIGMDIIGTGDLESFYGAKPIKDRRPTAWPYVETGLMIAASDRWEAGIGYEPYVGRNLLVQAPDGFVDRWIPTLVGVLGRVRRSFPVSRTLALEMTAGAGMYWLSAASVSLHSPYRWGDITGTGAGGKLEVGLERMFSRTAGMSLGVGYRYAVIPRISLKGQGQVNNADGSPARIDDSGPFITTTYKYYFGIKGG